MRFLDTIERIRDIAKTVREGAAEIVRGPEPQKKEPIVEDVQRKYYPLWKKSWQGTAGKYTKKRRR